jgi:lysozyme
MGYVIDISSYQSSVNWGQVDHGQGGVLGCYIKITEGSGYVSPAWAAQYAGARGIGVPVGAYHFADLGNASTEANHFADVYLSRQWQLVPVLDIETNGASAAWIVAFRTQFRARLLAAGITDTRFRVYSGQGFLTGALAPAGWIDDRSTIWAAQYASMLQFSHPALVMWQNKSTATVPGILGNVDEDQFMNGWTPAADQLAGGASTVDLVISNLSDDGKMLLGRMDALFSMASSVHATGWGAVQGLPDQTNELAATLGRIESKIDGVAGSLTSDQAAVLAAIAAQPTGGQVDVNALASALSSSLGNDVAVALGRRLAGTA